MTKNKLGDLNNHLFAQLERLAAEDLTPDQIETEANRAKAIVSISDQVIENSKLKLGAAKLYAEYGDKMLPLLPEVGQSTPPVMIAKKHDG